MSNRWPNRIIEYRPDCPLGEFLDNGKNWRIHPEAQRRGLVKILDNVGKVDALRAYHSKRYGGLTFYDGHLRRDIDPNETWPVLIADLTDDEADLVIATFDAVTPMAEIDYSILEGLVEDIGPQDEDIAAILATLEDVQPFGNTATDRESQGYNSPWSVPRAADKTTRVSVKIGDMETWLLKEIFERLLGCLEFFYETQDTPIPQTFEAIINAGLDYIESGNN